VYALKTMFMQNNNVRSILVIDDDVDDFDIVQEAVQEIDSQICVYFLSNCEEAGKYKDQEFDLVLLDINMPYHDGFAWLQDIRKSSRSQVPVVMYTNSGNPANIVRAYDDGANLYFTKPSSYTELVEGLRKLVNLDWSNPEAIKGLYCQKGHYRTFEVA
jgi:DNA-binding response OmpR family regulator